MAERKYEENSEKRQESSAHVPSSPIVNGKAFVILRVFASSSWIEHSPYHEDAKKREVFGYLCSSVLLTCKSFAAWKEFFFADSLRSSRLRG